MGHSHQRVYFVTYAVLLCLLGMTVVAARFEPGPWSATVAVTIAVAKTVLIVLFFMHVRDEAGLVRLFAVAGFFWLGLLLLFLISDYRTRGDVSPAGPGTTIGAVSEGSSVQHESAGTAAR